MSFFSDVAKIITPPTPLPVLKNTPLGKPLGPVITAEEKKVKLEKKINKATLKHINNALDF